MRMTDGGVDSWSESEHMRGSLDTLLLFFQSVPTPFTQELSLTSFFVDLFSEFYDVVMNKQPAIASAESSNAPPPRLLNIAPGPS